jgi:hypothetical protein
MDGPVVAPGKLFPKEQKMQSTKNYEDGYTVHGYKDRGDYLGSIADDRGIDRMAVDMIADVLGESEDFDGLINALEDFEGFEGEG